MLRALVISAWLATPLAAQEFFTLKGHGGPIMDIAVSPNGRIVTGSFDNSVGVWDGTHPRWFEGNRAAVNTVLFPTEDMIFAGGDDFNVWGWHVTDAKPIRLGGHTAKVTALAMNRAGDMLASASWDATIGLWPDPGSGQAATFLHGHEQGVNDIAFTADGSTLYSASVDGSIRVWDTATARETLRLVNHGFGVNTIVLNEQEGWIAYGASDGGTRMIDIATGAAIADFTAERRPVLAMAYHDSSGQLAVGDGQGYIMVVDTRKRRVTHDFRAARQGPVWALAFAPDGLNIHAGGIEDMVYSFPVDTMDEHQPMATATRSFLEDPENLPNGERQFKRKCSICHTLTEGSARKAGPSLHGLFGRRAGTVQDYSYSAILSGSEIVWSAATIDALFDQGPDHYIPGTKMPMQRIVQPADRDDLIDYLRTATGP